MVLGRRTIAAFTAAAALGVSAVPTVAPAATHKRHCVHYKTFKKHGKRYKRCTKYK
ncbi:MAG: hypothetical protein JO179_18535 [Solirubrobacterales bacterium]|nr:hypothetical protein [Solirubrobacterales bacterium]